MQIFLEVKGESWIRHDERNDPQNVKRVSQGNIWPGILHLPNLPSYRNTLAPQMKTDLPVHGILRQNI
ncbi:MAG: hypothetical protein AAF587_18860 [Bacteroidota bacterium]